MKNVLCHCAHKWRVLANPVTYILRHICMYLYTFVGYNKTIITIDISINIVEGAQHPELETTVLHTYILCYMDTELNYGETDKQLQKSSQKPFCIMQINNTNATQQESKYSFFMPKYSQIGSGSLKLQGEIFCIKLFVTI